MKKIAYFVIALLSLGLLFAACNPTSTNPTEGDGTQATTAPVLSNTTASIPTTKGSVPDSTTVTPTTNGAEMEIMKFQSLLEPKSDVRNPYYYALSDDFSDPKELKLLYYFDHFLEGEDTPTDAEVATLLQHQDESYVKRTKFYRLSKDRMEAELQNYFDISVEELSNRAFSGLIYLESSESYCYIDTRQPQDFAESVVVKSVEHLSDGTIRVKYSTSRYEKNVLLLKPNGNEYYILSNDLNTIEDPVLAGYAEFFSTPYTGRNPWWWATGHEYATPEDVRLVAFFDGGFEGEHELTDAEWEALRPMLMFPEYGLNGDWNRLSKDKMNAELQAVFGISLEDLPDSAYEGLLYLESTDCYYFCQTGMSSSPGFYPLAMQENADGTVSLTYESLAGIHIITLKPNGDSYLILSNVEVK